MSFQKVQLALSLHNWNSKIGVFAKDRPIRDCQKVICRLVQRKDLWFVIWTWEVASHICPKESNLWLFHRQQRHIHRASSPNDCNDSNLSHTQTDTQRTQICRKNKRERANVWPTRPSLQSFNFHSQIAAACKTISSLSAYTPKPTLCCLWSNEWPKGLSPCWNSYCKRTFNRFQ